VVLDVNLNVWVIHKGVVVDGASRGGIRLKQSGGGVDSEVVAVRNAERVGARVGDAVWRVVAHGAVEIVVAVVVQEARV
jgi:hypothetical protein